MPVLPTPFRHVLVTVLVAGAAFALRHWLVEPQAMGALCSTRGAPAWCLFRQGIVMGFAYELWGRAALLVLAASLLAPAPWSRRCLWAAIVLGVCTTVFYREALGSTLLLTCLLRALALDPLPPVSRVGGS